MVVGEVWWLKQEDGMACCSDGLRLLVVPMTGSI